MYEVHLLKYFTVLKVIILYLSISETHIVVFTFISVMVINYFLDQYFTYKAFVI